MTAVEEGETKRHLGCAVCSGLKDKEWATQKFGWEEGDTELPAAVGELRRVEDLRPDSARWLLLLQCPACLTHYLYQTDYEYLAGGTEDEQCLTRLTDAQAAEYLRP